MGNEQKSNRIRSANVLKEKTESAKMTTAVIG